MQKIAIPREIYIGDRISLKLYSTLSLVFGGGNVDEMPLTEKQIYTLMEMKNRREKSDIDQAIQHLEKLGILSAVPNWYYNLNILALHPKSDFTLCEVGAIKKLLPHPKLLQHYVLISAARSYQIEIDGRRNVICKLPISYFNEHEGISKRTVIRYNQQLEEMKLISIVTSKFEYDDMKRDINCYSLYEDRALLNKFVGINNRKDVMKSNDRRKVSALYNAYKKCPTKYSEEEKDELRSLVEQYNAECEELGKSQPDYLLKKKDMDVFDLF